MTRRDARQFLNHLIDRGRDWNPTRRLGPNFLIPDPPRVDLGGESNGTPVRIQSNNVESIGLEPTTSCLQSKADGGSDLQRWRRAASDLRFQCPSSASG